MLSRLAVIGLFICLFAPAVSVQAQSPQTITYQGRLTDDAGAALTDTVDLTFYLYNVPTGSTPIWYETYADVAVIDGLFEVVLEFFGLEMGDAFDGTVRYMSVQIDAGDESDPRVRIGMVPYAYKAIVCDTAIYAYNGSGISESEGDERYVNVDGDTISDDLYFDGDSDPEVMVNVGRVQIGPSYANLELGTSGEVLSKIWGQTWGEINLGHGTTDAYANLEAAYYGGQLTLADVDGDAAIQLIAANTGDSAVLLPDNGVNSDEILNEVGVASQINSNFIALGSSMADLETVTITIPASGYILVTGRCWGRVDYTSGQLDGLVQIDETEGGSYTYPYYTVFGISDGYSGATYLHSVHVNRLYFKDAGEYTFRLEGMEDGGGESLVQTADHQITALYIPTSYGTVEEVAADPVDHPDAVRLVAGDRPHGGSGETRYAYDLRYYELKAQAARKAALEAERELQQARNAREDDRSER